MHRARPRLFYRTLLRATRVVFRARKVEGK